MVTCMPCHCSATPILPRFANIIKPQRKPLHDSRALQFHGASFRGRQRPRGRSIQPPRRPRGAILRLMIVDSLPQSSPRLATTPGLTAWPAARRVLPGQRLSLSEQSACQNSFIFFGVGDGQVLEPARPVLVNASLHTVLNALRSDSRSPSAVPGLDE